MKLSTAVTLAFLDLVVSQPHNHHAAHLAAHKKRGGIVTEWVSEWVTTTVIKWVDELPTNQPQAASTTVATVAPAAPTTVAPAQFFEGVTTVTPVAP